MNNLLKICYDGACPTVSGRELHAALLIETRYNDWFKRMCEYGFEEGKDFYSILSKTSEGGRPASGHQLTIDMAKQICMIQRTEIGRNFRQYFISVEEQWNSPEAVMARALRIANEHLDVVQQENRKLLETIAVQHQQIAEIQPKASYYDIVLQCKDLVTISVIAKDYGLSAKQLNKYLNENGIQYKQSKIWLLYQKYASKGYTQTKTFCEPDSYGQMHTYVHTYWTQAGRLFIYDLLKSNDILPIVEQESENYGCR